MIMKELLHSFLIAVNFPIVWVLLMEGICAYKAPPMSNSEFYNYKGFFSVVLLAAVDAHYRFTWIDVGQYGKHAFY